MGGRWSVVKLEFLLPVEQQFPVLLSVLQAKWSEQITVSPQSGKLIIYLKVYSDNPSALAQQIKSRNYAGRKVDYCTQGHADLAFEELSDKQNCYTVTVVTGTMFYGSSEAWLKAV